MNAFLEEQYFRWLYRQICSVELRSPSRNFQNLFEILFRKEFVWIVPNDDNRVEDGKDLRYEFLDDENLETRDRLWLDQGCSMLELLISLARKLEFETGSSAIDWFWELLENLDLKKYNDRITIPKHNVEAILDRVIWRTYDYDGGGGLFPLVRASKDQRKVELWYQLNTYVLERNL